MDFEQAVVRYASPAVCGIKPASLFSVPQDALSGCMGVQRLLSRQHTQMALVRRCDGNMLVFVYDEPMLSEVLSRADVRRQLLKKGYPAQGGTGALLSMLFERLSRGGAFPHEIGLFLGYPPEDVEAFERNAGRNAKCTAGWQVYGDVEQAERTERLYRDCCARCAAMWQCGVGMADLCRTYRRTVGQETSASYRAKRLPWAALRHTAKEERL